MRKLFSSKFYLMLRMRILTMINSIHWINEFEASIKQPSLANDKFFKFVL